MSQIAPYRVPVFSWPTVGPARSFDVTVTGAASGGFPSGTVSFSRPVGSGSLPLFPFVAEEIEDFLNNQATDTNTYRVRWLWGDGGGVWTWTPGSTRDFDPKLAIEVINNEGYTSGSISFVTSPDQGLTTDYLSVPRNWLGGANISASFPADGGNVKVIHPYAPEGVWNPGVLSYGDDRAYSETMGMAVNPATHRKSVTSWGKRYSRIITLPVVRATQVYAYRRFNPLFEEDAIKRLNPNNLYERLSQSLRDEIDYYLFTEVPLDFGASSAAYFAAFKGRRVKITDSLLSNDSDARSFVGDDQRLFNITLDIHDIAPLTNGGI